MGKFDFFKGRQLLLTEIPSIYHQLLGHHRIKQRPAMRIDKNEVTCLRCGTSYQKKRVRLGNKHPPVYYCPTCILLGRVQSDVSFYYCPENKSQREKKIEFNWEGHLAPSQVQGSKAIEQIIELRGNLLIHGVTGAGKTEMLFAGIFQALKIGQRVCLASPRVDVCLELYPRLKKVFPKVPMALLYGKQTEPYVYTQLVICTTHQLLRFHQAFDVVIIDEIDAFPYNAELFLTYGLHQAKKEKCGLVYLTATPSRELLVKVKAGQLKLIKVPMRYHGQALPVPESIWVWSYYAKVKKGNLPRKLQELLQNQLDKGKITLIFCPTIDLMIGLEKLLIDYFDKVKLTSASAKDPLREAKIQALRHKKYQLFLTTTILERGVTFNGIDVIVFGSNHRVFSQGSLVQIAGRVGRSFKEPTGNVYFIHDGWSRGMVQAQKQIHIFNELAEKERNKYE